MKIKLVIFDLDGTLLNSIQDIATCTNYALQQLNQPTHPVEIYKNFVGNGIYKLFELSLPKAKRSKENINLMHELFTKSYNKHMTDESKPYEGIPELLKELHQKGIKIAVASNKYQAATKHLISHFFPNLPFVAVLGQRQNIETKPNPAIIQEILNISGVTPKQTLYVGDSGVDMQTAINSKTIACGVSWGFRPRQELECYNPPYIVDNSIELRELIYTAY